MPKKPNKPKKSRTNNSKLGKRGKMPSDFNFIHIEKNPKLRIKYLEKIAEKLPDKMSKLVLLALNPRSLEKLDEANKKTNTFLRQLKSNPKNLTKKERYKLKQQKKAEISSLLKLVTAQIKILESFEEVDSDHYHNGNMDVKDKFGLSFDENRLMATFIDESLERLNIRTGNLEHTLGLFQD